MVGLLSISATPGSRRDASACGPRLTRSLLSTASASFPWTADDARPSGETLMLSRWRAGSRDCAYCAQAAIRAAGATVDGSVATISIYLAATFVAALVTGIAGFAFGLVAAAVWLHILTPLKTATLIIAFGLVVQGVSVWKLRGALRWSRLWPFLLGAAVGVPLGVAILGWASPDYVRVGVGVLLVLYSSYSLARPPLKPLTGVGATADAGVGFLNGILGGLTGLAGILTTIWCGMRGWGKDEQRAVFQPIGVAIFAMSGLWLGVKGAISSDTVWLFVVGLSALLAGTWAGVKRYRVIYGDGLHNDMHFL